MAERVSSRVTIQPIQSEGRVLGIEGFTGQRRPDDALCAAEPIRTPGSIQPHGCLLVADPAADMALVAASRNADRLAPQGVDALSCRLDQLVGPDLAGCLARSAAAGRLIPGTPLEAVLPSGGTSFDLVSHAHDGLVLIELTEVHPGDGDAALLAARQLQRAMAELRGSGADLDGLAATITRSIRRVTGYERVLIYRFDEEWNGQAVAEDLVADHPQPLLGLHFPESDIPAQARALYRTSLLRWTLSRDAVAAPVLTVPGHGRPIDLSHARLRSQSPVHLQYHRNLGVDGAMSISIMDGARLWGLVVCHHRGPHRTTAAQRAAAMALTDAFALRLHGAELAGADSERRAEQHRYTALVSQLADSDDLDRALTSGPVSLLDLFDVPGAAVLRGRQLRMLGRVPPRAAIAELAEWLRSEAPPGDVFATARLPTDLPGWAHADTASGLLAVFLDAARTDILMWFRPEEPAQVSWGGNPAKIQAAGGTVAPRQSFERWVEVRRGTARPWAAHEVETAALLRHAVTEVILRNVRRVAALSEQLRQSQKMEAVGQLTGGLAHDFNNLLAGITSSLELAQMRIAQGRVAELDRYLAAAMGAATRAAALTHRLLAFSRRQTLDPKPVDPNRLIASMADLIRRTTGPGITLDAVGSAGLWTILCDPNQLENALLNLALNARDAMPEGGHLTIEAANVRLDDAVAAGFDLPPGHYVGISVSDTGVGMSAETAVRVFEPFFTTKPLGRGTGLGLSMVYGFTRQSGGSTRVYSELDQGTTVRMYLPRHLGPAEAEPVQVPVDAPAPSGARVLVVDDESLLRAMVCEALTETGYVVAEAADAKQALDSLATAPPPDLLLTDVGLPGGTNGRQLADAARERFPELKVLFMTGYAESAALAGGLLGPQTQVMTKPFNLQALRDKVRSMMDATR